MKYFPVLIIALVGMTASAQADVNEVIRAMIDNQRGDSGQVTITMTVEKPGAITEYVIDSVGDGFERSLIRVLAPPREAGQAFLIDGDNLWLYNPRLRRTLRLPPSGRTDAFLGSDISYNDLAGRDFETDYEASITGESEDAIELTLVPRPGAPTPYGRIVVTADAETYAPLEFVYYDQREQAVRRILFSEFDRVSDTVFPTRIEVRNLLREGERTTVVMSDYDFDLDVPEACFRESALERGCL
jgi:outer membrane lipoprotein-sorting protein